MKSRLKLKLKPLAADDPESQRIYKITGKTIEGFNAYVADFYGTISILKEKLDKPGTGKNREEAASIRKDVEYMENKLNELFLTMKNLAEEMSFLVDVEEDQRDGEDIVVSE